MIKVVKFSLLVLKMNINSRQIHSAYRPCSEKINATILNLTSNISEPPEISF